MKHPSFIDRISRIALVCVMAVGMLGSLVSSCNSVAADAVVTFPDPNLEAAIRQAIRKPSGDIYQSDLDGLTFLYAPDRDITNLSGLEHCTSLGEAILDWNHINDLSPLQNLTSLTKLSLGYTEISNVSPLAGLTNLIHLYLGGNQISNITPLSSLTNLTRLSLVANNISDITSIGNLTNLTHLDLRGNQVTDLSPLSSLTNLYRLDLQRNEISELAPLSGLNELAYLYLYSNQISDVSPLSSLTNLRGLTLQRNRITDLAPLSNLTMLYALDLQWNYISNVQPLLANLGLQSGCTVELGNNPLSFDSIEIYIPQLQARGVSVPYIFPAGASVFTATQTGTAVFQATSSRVENLSLSAVSIDDVPAEGRPNLIFPDGLFSFSMSYLRPGDTVTIQLTLPSSPSSNATSNVTSNTQYQYWKYGPTPSDPKPHWYEISSRTCGGNRVLFQITDGGLGDDDLTANGVIIDEGGPGYPVSVPIVYGLKISSTEGGSVATPGEGTFLYLPGIVVDLVASPDDGYEFVNWSGDVATIADVHDASTTITMNGNYSITANFAETARQCIATSTGTGSACFTASHGTIENLKRLTVPPGAPAGIIFPHGMFSFNVTGLSSRQTITLNVTLPGAVPVGTRWWKYQNGRWYSLPNVSDDGDNIVAISLTDGGEGDADGNANGRITDPGGPGYPGAVGWETYPTNKARVLLPWIASVSAVIAGLGLLVLGRRSRGSQHI